MPGVSLDVYKRQGGDAVTEHLELVKRAKSGDEEAFIRLMESQSDCMYTVSYTHLHPLKRVGMRCG